MHQERTNKHANDDAVPDGAVPAYLLDREGVSRAKVLSNTVKQKRKEKAGKWDVPIPKVCVLRTACPVTGASHTGMLSPLIILGYPTAVELFSILSPS